MPHASFYFIIFAAFTLAGCHRAQPNLAERATPVVVQAAKLEPGYVAERAILGEVRARRSGEIGFEVVGTVHELEVDAGDEVAAGAVLARLDPVRFAARQAEAAAAVAEALAQKNLTASTLARTLQMRESDVLSAQDEDDAREAFAAASARLARAEATLALATADLEKSVLRAPYAATVEARLADLGSTAAPGVPVLRLTERAPVEVRLTIPVELAAQLAPGARLLFTAAGFAGEGTLARLRASRDVGTRAVEGFLLLAPALTTPPLPGTVGTVRLPVSVATSGAWLPRAALTEGTRGLWACYAAVPLVTDDVQTGDVTHRLERIDLEWLHAEGERVFVRGALRDGDQVVSAGLHRLGPGHGVRLTENAP